MTPESAKKYLEVIKAFAEGKTIQVRVNSGGGWYNEPYPNFYADREYRVKPEPIEVELWWCSSSGSVEKKKFREVIE